MPTYALTHQNDAVLLRDLDALVSQERGTMTAVVAHLAEVDARRLYLPAGYPSMYEYCLRKLGWSEQAALKRVRAARIARRFPVIFDALAEGRLHLTAIVLLAPHLTAENADELLAAAAHRTTAEIEELLARWFPKPDVPARIEAIAPGSPVLLSLRTVTTSGDTDSTTTRGRAGSMISAQAPRVTPLAPERFVLQLTMGKDTYDKLRYVQALLSHQVPRGMSSWCSIARSMHSRSGSRNRSSRPPRSRARAHPHTVPARTNRARTNRAPCSRR